MYMRRDAQLAGEELDEILHVLGCGVQLDGGTADVGMHHEQLDRRVAPPIARHQEGPPRRKDVEYQHDEPNAQSLLLVTLRNCQQLSMCARGIAA